MLVQMACQSAQVGAPRRLHYVFIQLTPQITHALRSLFLSLSHLPALKLFFMQEYGGKVKQDKMEFSAKRLRKYCRNMSRNSPQITNAGEGVEKRVPSHTGWECKLVQPPWKTIWRYLTKLNLELPYDSAIPLLGIYPDKLSLKKMHAPVCSLQQYSQLPRHGNNLNVHRQMNG